VINSRLAYRTRQFWLTLFGPQKKIDLPVLSPYLTPVQIVLFKRMHPSEQAHAVRVLERLQVAGHREPELMSAALLHDVGKILSPLAVWERVVIVLGRRFFPDAARRWSQGTPRGLRHPFVVAERHPVWGADLAAQTGAPPRTVELIGRHQQPLSGPPGSPAERMLAALQSADDSD
jgi:hypothetical protein